MSTTIQNCYNNILSRKVTLQFSYPPYYQQAEKIVNSGGTNAAIALALDELSHSDNFSNLLHKTSLGVATLTGEIYSPIVFDTTSISDPQCSAIQALLIS